MRIYYLFSLTCLLVTIFTAAIAYDFDGDTLHVDDGIVEVERDENVVAEERLVYERPVPSGPTYFHEPFDTRAEFLKRWVYSKAKKDGKEDNLAKYDGKWSVEEPANNPIEKDLGLILKSRAKHHAISVKLDKPFEFDGKPLIVQYEVKFQTGMDCGGAYIKLLSKTDELNLKLFTDKTPYTIMFGPDKCGNDHKLHFIFRYKNPKTGAHEEKHADQPTVKLDDYFVDRKTHLYTLIVNPDNTYEMKVDNKVVAAGSLLHNVSPSVNPPKEIGDPNDQKPEEWDDREKIPDPVAKKPHDWDESEPATIVDENVLMPFGWLEDEEPYIPDPAAVKPDDWDAEIDGEWEAPLIDNPKCKRAPGCGKWEQPTVANPNYKGIWEAPMIDNPDFKGEWKPRMIPNPDYFEDSNPYNMTPIAALGLELWSMTDNIIFDNFIIADNATVVEKFTAITWELKNIQERHQFSTAGWWNAVKTSTAEHPWLWVVYSIVLVLPILLLFICFCPKPGSAKVAIGHRKKFDYPLPDVRDPIGVIKEEEETQGEEVGNKNRGAGEWKNVGGSAATEIGMTAGWGSQTGDQAGGADSLISEGSPKRSGSPRRRTTRKE